MSLAPQIKQTSGDAPEQSVSPVTYRAVSVRSILVAMALIPFNIVWIVLMERVDGRAFSTTLSVFFTAIFSLLGLVIVNTGIKRLAPRFVLRQGELLTIFSMLSIASIMAAVDFGSPLITLIGHGFWFATPENKWLQTFGNYLPRWLTVSDPEALKGYYLGNSSLYQWSTIQIWLRPLFWWGLFIMALLWVMACINTLLRAQWTEKERLSYPMVQLPFAMTTEKQELYRSRLFWMGFVFAGGLNLINGLNRLYPSVPSLTFNGYDALQWFTSAPWNAIGTMPLAIFPCVIGIGYLLPVDLLFSCWFFFLFWRAEKVIASAMGYMADAPKFPYIDEQMFGGYMAICAFSLWKVRRQLWAILRGGLRGERMNDQHEPMSYRTALFGGLGGFVFLVGFSAMAGLPVQWGALFFLIYFSIAISVTRMRAELGPPAHDLHFIGPDQSISSVVGTRNLDAGTMTVFTLFYWFNRAYRSHAMPHEMEAFKMAQMTRTSMRGVLMACLFAAMVGIVSVFWVTLHVSYQLGAAGRIYGWSSLGFGGEAYNRLSSWFTSPTKPNADATWGMGIGFAIASALMLIRTNFQSWPFHALGFSISGGWSMMWAWLSLFVAWVLKTCVLRYGGLKGFRDSLPLCFGIILGDFVIGGIWTLLGLIFHVPIYSLWSG